jgi:hypothetical protein
MILIFFIFNFVADREKEYFSVDEKLHIKNSKLIAENNFFITNVTKYIEFPAPTTPLANVFFSFFIFISEDIAFLRIINLFLSILCIFLFHKILIENGNFDEFKVLSFFAFPYFLILSQIVMTDIFALTMCMFSVYFFILFQKTGKLHNLLLSSFFSCLSFFSRQYYIFLIASQILYLLLKNKKYLIHYSIFVIPVILYIIYQGGFTPKEYRGSYKIEMIPIKIFIISSVGFYFLPLISNVEINFRYFFLFLILLILYIFGILSIECKGITCRLLNIKLLGIILSFIGLWIIIHFIKKRIPDIVMKFYLIFFLIEQFFNSMPYDRYFLSIYWIFIIFSDKKISKIQFIYLLAISIVYLSYKILF